MPTITLTWTNNGISYNTQLALNTGAPLEDLDVLLYTNSGVVPAVTSVIGDLTECTDGGYSRITLTGASWSGSTTGGVATYTYPSITFFFTGSPGPETIYGVGFMRTTVLQALANLTTPYAITPSGGSLTLDITQTGQQC